MSEKLILCTADYAIFGVIMTLYAATGLYFRIFVQQKTNEDYLLAGRDMCMLPVSFSLMATIMSAITFVGIPAEMYLYGTSMVFMIIGFLLGPVISSIVFIPVYFNTGVSTAYEYLEKRFGRSTRRILSVIFLFQYTLFDGVVLYAPALALSAVTSLSIWTSVISIGVVCTFYCTMGGMKAILWTDVFQSCLMYLCLLIIIIKGSIDHGGIGKIFQSAFEGGRVILPTFQMDFSTRYTMWNVFLQNMVIVTQNYGGNQVQVQRQLTLKNIKRSRIASMISGPMVTVFHLMSCLCGLIIYVHFKSCDPMTSPSKPIHTADQLLPYYINSALGQYPGLPGLCITGIFSASLSTISSAVNSMAGVTCEDIIRPLFPKLSGSLLITKMATVFFGVMSILMTYFVASLGNLVKASLIAMGMVAGPALGIFILATLTTTANEVGANVGVLAGFVFAGCVSFIPNTRHYPELPVGRNCTEPEVGILNFTSIINSTSYGPMNSTDPSVITLTKDNLRPDNFPVSYMWISTMSLVICVVVGYLGSLITSYIKGYSKPVPLEVLSPVRQWFIRNKEEVNKFNICEVSNVDVPDKC